MMYGPKFSNAGVSLPVKLPTIGSPMARSATPSRHEGDPMNLKLFAEKHALRVGRDGCGDSIIPGRSGQIYEYNPKTLGCMVLTKSSRRWNPVHRKLVAAGCQVVQNGDTEGAALFDPQNPTQVKVVVQAVVAQRKRRLSEAQRLAASQRLKSWRTCTPSPDVRLISSRAS
jgi:hypothetical protein